MKKSKLIEVLSVLKEDEWDALLKWLSGQLKHQKDDVLRFFRILYHRKKETNEEPNMKQAIFNQLYPRQAYNDGRMRKLMHQILKEIERFLIHGYNSEDGLFFAYEKLLEFYRYHYTPAVYHDYLTKWDLDIAKMQYENEDFYEQKSKLAKYQSYEHVLQNPNQINHFVLKQLEYQQFGFVISQLQLYFSLLANGTNQSYDFPLDFLFVLLQWVELTPDFLMQPVISTYYHANKMLLNKEGENPHFAMVAEAVRTGVSFLRLEERSALGVLLRNYASREIQRGKESYRQIRFDLFMEHLELGLAFNNNQITSNTFRSIVGLGLSLGEFQKVRNFMEVYANYLPESLSQPTMQYCRAKCLFYEGKLSESLRCLLSVDSQDDLRWELDLRILRIKILYHLDEHDLVIAQLNTLRAYLSRHEALIPRLKSNAKAFVNFCARILNQPTKNSLQKLWLEIEQSNTLEKGWLISVTEGLIQ